MKTFLITWGSFCVLVIVGLFIAYATDNFPGVPTPQSRSEDPDPDLSRMPMNWHKSGQVGLETEEGCSPCEENLKRLKEAMQTVAHKQADAVKSENLARVKKTFEQAQKATDVFYHERNAENLARAEKALKQFREAANTYYGEERFDKALQLVGESDPETARQFERERLRPESP